MRRAKVFGGNTHIYGTGYGYNRAQRRTIIKATSQKQAADLLSVSLYEFRQFWCETGNDLELEVMKDKPLGTILYDHGEQIRDFRPFPERMRKT